MKKYKIFPSIGIGRVGGSLNNFFLCPEELGSKGIEIDSNGDESELQNYKDLSGLIKRQGVRFRVLEFDETSGQYKQISLDNVKITWKVILKNIKASVVRPFSSPPQSPPNLPLQLKSNHGDLEISGEADDISGKNSTPKEIKGSYKTTTVKLGDVLTDKIGNLIVLGGHGKSGSPTNAPIGLQFNPQTGEFEKTPQNNFYYNEDWFDDTCDGTINATIKINGESHDVEGAWIIIAPPDYAPQVKGVVTLHDIIEQACMDDLEVPDTFFNRDIEPIITSFNNHQWVHKADYSIDSSLEELSQNTPENRSIRFEAVKKIRRIEKYLNNRAAEYKLTNIQRVHLRNYISGNFEKTIVEDTLSGDYLTKVALTSTIGQGFFPGIEGGIILKNSDIYSSPFTIDQALVKPGEITGLMALPWQADFLECQGNWWPSQRPDLITLENDDKRAWARTKNGPLNPVRDHRIVVKEFNRFGFIKESGGKQIELERDPEF